MSDESLQADVLITKLFRSKAVGDAKRKVEPEKNVPERQIALFPFFPDQAAAIPTHIAKSGVFSYESTTELSEAYFKDVVLYQSTKNLLKFSGFHLSQTEADIFMCVLRLIKGRMVGEDGKVMITKAELLRQLGWVDSGSNYAKLLESFKRLSESQFYLESTQDDGSSSKESLPLKLFSFNQKKDHVILWIPEESLPMFESISYLNWEARKRIDHRQGLAKSIQLFAAAYKQGANRKLVLDDLKAKVGYRSPRDKFVKSLEKAFSELERHGILENVWIKKELGVWYCGWTLPKHNKTRDGLVIDSEDEN
jgi:hypothetical protein